MGYGRPIQLLLTCAPAAWALYPGQVSPSPRYPKTAGTPDDLPSVRRR
jgi:hypothetical protein